MPLLQTFGNATARAWERFGPNGSPADYELISTVIVSGTSTASVTFDVSALSTTYKNLQARSIFRSGINVNGDDYGVRFNGDSTYTNYRSHYLYGSGSAVTSATLQSTQFPGINISINSADASHTSGAFGAGIIDFLDPFSSVKNKTVRALSGMPQSGTANYGVTLSSGAWFSTSIVTSVTFYPYPGTSPFIAAGSRISLYGLR
jgi:hypothetical protein